jgi:hypothetical protein
VPGSAADHFDEQLVVGPVRDIHGFRVRRESQLE